jgi:hypothetical protein
MARAFEQPNNLSNRDRAICHSQRATATRDAIKTRWRSAGAAVVATRFPGRFGKADDSG